MLTKVKIQKQIKKPNIFINIAVNNNKKQKVLTYEKSNAMVDKTIGKDIKC